MNPLYAQLMGQRTQGFQNGSLSPAAQQFANFAKNFRQMSNGTSPQMFAQQLLNSGQMTQEQFNQIRAMANQILGTNY